MMSLRLRLTFKLGAAFVLIWVLAAAWMLNDLRNQMMFSLDQRLVASARMVAGLTEQMPGLASVSGGAHLRTEQLNVPGAWPARSVPCAARSWHAATRPRMKVWSRAGVVFVTR